MAALRSKIARLPFRIREEVNRMLHDGAEGQTILDYLNTLPEVTDKINAQNLTNWRQSGYQEWLAQYQRVEGTRALGELAVRLAEAGGGNLAAGASAVVAGHILENLQDIKTLDLCDPENIPVIEGITDAITKITRNDIQIKRNQIVEQQTELRRQKAELEERAQNLAEKKFMFETGRRLRNLALSGEIQAIVGGTADADEQIEQLMLAMFGADAVDRAKRQAANA